MNPQPKSDHVFQFEIGQRVFHCNRKDEIFIVVGRQDPANKNTNIPSSNWDYLVEGEDGVEVSKCFEAQLSRTS